MLIIRHIALKGKPVCLSTGASYLSEVEEALRVIRSAGCKDIALLHCVLSYPTSPDDANLEVIRTLKRVFPDVKAGFSDHIAPDESMLTLSTAFMMGAQIIEKHFTLDKTLTGNDHYHAGDPDDFRKAINNFRYIAMISGSGEIIPRREARRSLVLTRDMTDGEIITSDCIMAKRPGTGISPNFTGIITGRRIKGSHEADTILGWDMV